MKVAFVCQHFDLVLPPNQSSIGIWTYEVARRLGATCETTVIARRSRGEPAHHKIDGVRIELISCLPVFVWARASRAWTRLRPGAQPLFAQRYYAIDFLAQAVRQIKHLSPDVIHVQNLPQYVPALRRAAPNAAIVLHMHCDWLAQLDHNAMAGCVAAADLIVGCSEHVISLARTRFAGTGANFAVLPNGAPVDRLPHVAPQRKRNNVLFVGRVSPEKGIHTLLEAWPMVISAHPDASLDIVGPSAETPREFLVDLSDDPDVQALSRFYPRGSAYRGSYSAALREMVPPDLTHTVTFAGPEPYERIIERCAACSLLMNPSLSESFGMSLVEALATGTPVVATRAGGMPEIIAATGGGVLVEKNNPTALAAAINRLLSQPALSAEIGRCGANNVARLYSWTRIAALTRGLYEEAISIRRAVNSPHLHRTALTALAS